LTIDLKIQQIEKKRKSLFGQAFLEGWKETGSIFAELSPDSGGMYWQTAQD